MTLELGKTIDTALSNHVDKSKNVLVDHFYQVELVFKTHFKFKFIILKILIFSLKLE